MVLVSASITLARVSDGATGTSVTSITEEYYLSNSKTSQNGGSWVTAPPTWTAGKYMWTRSKIVYSNPASTAYTTPICDSSWEAVNEVQVGGRNLLVDSEKEVGITATREFVQFADIAPIFEKYGLIEYTISFDIKSADISQRSFVQVYCQNGSGSKYDIGAKTVPVTTEYTRQSVTVTPKLQNESETQAILAFYGIYDTGNIPQIKNVKVEKGNKATDWTPAPEDVQGQIDTSIKSVDVEYYLSTSLSALSGGSWSTTAPAWENGKYMWSRTKTTLQDGTTAYSPSANGVCIAGAKGDTGTAGANGKDGKTSYLHIKYSDDGQTFTENDGETLGAYIGTLVDFNEVDSLNFADYTWKKFTEDVDEELEDIRKVVEERDTETVSTCNEIILSALRSYVETSNFEQFQETISAQLQVMADEILMKFNTATNQISNVNGDLQTKFEEVYKYISFAGGNITLGNNESAITLVIENDLIAFKRNGETFGTWDGDNFRVGNIYVGLDEMAQFGNHGWVPFEEGDIDGLDLIRVGG